MLKSNVQDFYLMNLICSKSEASIPVPKDNCTMRSRVIQITYDFKPRFLMSFQSKLIFKDNIGNQIIK